MCCSHGENVLPLSEEAHDWRCRFRHIFKDSSDVVSPKADGLYGEGSYHCFYAIATTQMELRIFETTLPQPLLDEILDITYNFYAVRKASNKHGLVDEELVHRLFLVTHRRYLRVFQVLFDHEWEVIGDGWALALLLITLCSCWVPAPPFAASHQAIVKIREQMEHIWRKSVVAKITSEFMGSLQSG